MYKFIGMKRYHYNFSEKHTKVSYRRQTQYHGNYHGLFHVFSIFHNVVDAVLFLLSTEGTAVARILDTIVQALVDDETKTRRFSFAEIAFFHRWWVEQSETKQAQVKTLVASKQLEFINGGWCMHDEATPHFTEMLDQTTRGHMFINATFGPDAAPKVAWQIDPFGMGK